VPKPVLQVMAHKLGFLFRDKEVAVIEDIRCRDSYFLVEGYLGKGGSFSLPASVEDLRKVLDLAEGLPIMAASELAETIGEEPQSRKKKDRDPVSVDALGFKKKSPEPEVAATSGWLPPTKALVTDRLKLSKPGEKELMAAFLAINVDPYKGRKKLSAIEEKVKSRIIANNDIAKSFILTGDRNSVKNWINYLKNNPNLPVS